MRVIQQELTQTLDGLPQSNIKLEGAVLKELVSMSIGELKRLDKGGASAISNVVVQWALMRLRQRAVKTKKSEHAILKDVHRFTNGQLNKWHQIEDLL